MLQATCGRSILSSLCLLLAPTLVRADTQIVFPESARVVDITQPPYNATPDDDQDDTEAFNRALQDRVNLIYVPNGTYIISDTLRWGPTEKRQIIQGQSREGTIIRLRDQALGFGDPSNPKPMIWTGQHPAQRFRNGLRNLTIDTGLNNPGAIGARFIANNQGGIRSVTIRSGDPQGEGVIGLDLGYTDEQGPLLIRDFKVQGFRTGIRTATAVNSITMEHVTVENQLEAGLLNDGQCVSIRGLTSRNAVPALVNRAGPGLVVLIDSELTWTGSDQGEVAVINEAGMFARNLRTPGYRQAISNSTGTMEDADGPDVTEFVSHGVLSNFPTPPRSLNLPIEEIPDMPWQDVSQWVSVTDFGPARPVRLIRLSDNKRFDREDWSEALQRAIDSGAKVVYFPVRQGGEYGIYGTVRIRGNVERIIGLENTLGETVQHNDQRNIFADEFRPTLIIEDGTAPVVRIERFDSWYCAFRVEQRSNRTLVLSSFSIYELETYPGSGDVFMEDMRCKQITVRGTRLWGRQINPEGWEEPRILNDGGHVWILGLKTENPTTIASTIHGGKTEIVGGFFYSNKAFETPIRMFHNDNSSFSFSGGGWKTRRGRAFDYIVEETRGQETRRLPRELAYPRGEQSMIPLYVGYSRPADAPPSAPSQVVAQPAGSSSIQVSWEFDGQSADGFAVELERDGQVVASTVVATELRQATVSRNVRAGESYAVRVSAFNGAGQTFAGEPIIVQIPPGHAPGSGTGLHAVYYNDVDLGNAKATRTDPQIAFDFSAQRPAQGMPARGYSIRWTGLIEPQFSDPYTFIVETHGGVRMWVDDQLIIDRWQGGVRRHRGTAHLQAGQQHVLRLEYVNHAGGGGITVDWSSPNQSRQTIPATQLHPKELTWPIVSMETRTDTLREDGSARTYVVRRTGPTDTNLSVPWRLHGTAVQGVDYVIQPSTLDFPPGSDRFEFTINPIDNDRPQPDRLAIIEVLPTSRVLTSGAVLRLTIEDDDRAPPGQGTGLLGTYFDQIDFTEPKATRLDATIAFGWDKRKPHNDLSEAGSYSIRWEGFIQPQYSEEYTFEIDTGRNNAVKLVIDGKTIIDVGLPEGRRRGRREALELTGKITLEAGRKYPIIVEYVQPRDYGAMIRLLWSSLTQFQQVVPVHQLYPPE